MLKYFKMPKEIVDDYEGYEDIIPKKLEEEINNYTAKNNLKIISITSVDKRGMFVAFEKKVGE